VLYPDIKGVNFVARFIKYRITTLEAIKIGNNLTRQNYDHETLRYISGSALRGAFIANYISKYGEEGLANILNLRFTNAYIVTGGKRAVPVCANFLTAKDDREKTEYPIFNIFNPHPGERVERSVSIGGFGIYGGEKITGVPVETGQNLHISTKVVQENDSRNLFQYEYINQGQQFDGFVIIDDSGLLSLVTDIFSETDNVWYIGGSKGSGYGQCCISDVGEQDKEFEFSIQSTNGYFYLMFLSDAIIRDENGNLTSEIPVELIQKNTGLEDVNRVDMAVRLVNIGGYNQKMRSTLQQYSSIGAGSIFKYQCRGTIQPESLKQWIDQGIGERRQDGYGRFTMFNDLDFKFFEKDRPSNAVETAICMSEKGLELILKRIFDNKLKTALKADMLTLTTKFSNPDKQFKAKIGNIISHLRSIYNLQPDTGRSQTENFYQRIMQKMKNNPKVFSFYKLSSLNGLSPLDFMVQCIDTSDSGFVKRKCTVINEKYGLNYAMNENDIYRIGIDFAIDVFKLILAGKENYCEREI
jgi:CRISPR-associated protein Csx10